MRLNTLGATAAIAVLALGATACKSSSTSGAAAPPSNPPATQTQADSPSQETSASPAASVAANASTPPSAPPSTSASSAPTAAAAAGGAINACSLLTGAQASSLTATTYGPGTASTIAKGQDQCDYPYSGAGIDLTVIVYEPDSGVSWNTMQAVLSGVGNVSTVPGVGDKAMFAGIELDIQTGKWLIAIQGADKLNQDTNSIAVGKALVAALASK